MEEEIIIGKYLVKTERYYTKDHHWVLVKGNIAQIGITDYLQKSFGDVLEVKLPQKGEDYDSGDIVVRLETKNGPKEIYTPLGGQISEINEQLYEEPYLINEEPYDAGWLFLLKIKDILEIEDLLTTDDYIEILKEIEEEEYSINKDTLLEEMESSEEIHLESLECIEEKEIEEGH